MNIGLWLQTNTTRLAAAGIATARLDCLILLEDQLATDRALLLAHLETGLSNQQQTMLNDFIIRRCGHEPLAYIRGKAAFYGRTFYVTKDVLVPRPESESMITLLLWIQKTYDLQPAATRLVDVGTGSGCLGVTAALELNLPKVDLIDNDSKALEVAHQNAQAHQVNATCYESDLLSEHQKCTIALANLPYVPDDHVVNQAARHEPAQALFSGVDGLDHYRRLFGQLRGSQTYLIVEALQMQHAALRQLAADYDYAVLKSDGLAVALLTR